MLLETVSTSQFMKTKKATDLLKLMKNQCTSDPETWLLILAVCLQDQEDSVPLNQCQNKCLLQPNQLPAPLQFLQLSEELQLETHMDASHLTL